MRYRPCRLTEFLVAFHEGKLVALSKAVQGVMDTVPAQVAADLNAAVFAINRASNTLRGLGPKPTKKTSRKG